ncbi:unnamed protein product [Phaedon cochleariae]|uniref:Pseudouridine synthase I TruA alpha/beta domain-containing protein n=1 Tax=Phaedon cochleariae TaxID=80249 RepID=A0A9P0DNY4_PHACE|nr:unnamed protein product [Phaedon cochleariae]
MDTKIIIKKQPKVNENSDLENYSKEELIQKVISLTAHNTQLKNIIAKSAIQEQKQKSAKPFDFSKCKFKHVALKIFYLGWEYKGFVVQEDTTQTVEYHLFEALTRARLIRDRPSSNYHRCGRTDKGVSAFGQVISIDLRSNLSENESNNFEKEIDYCKVLNSILPDSIQCVAWSPVDATFSARFDCSCRTYRYYFPKGSLDIASMKVAAEKLLGPHDFRNFCKMDVGNGVTEFIRNISAINIEPVCDQNIDDGYSIYMIAIRSKAFLWHQIRCIMGILFLIGQNKEEPNLINELLDVEKTPRKPEYRMANELPLNLYFCEYDGIKWHYNDSLNQVIEKLSSLWTTHALKETMLKDMLISLKNDLQTVCSNNEDKHEKCLSEHLLPKHSPNNYLPVMKRQTCNSLESKIEHFAKRKRIQIVEGNSGNISK